MSVFNFQHCFLCLFLWSLNLHKSRPMCLKFSYLLIRRFFWSVFTSEFQSFCRRQKRTCFLHRKDFYDKNSFKCFVPLFVDWAWTGNWWCKSIKTVKVVVNFPFMIINKRITSDYRAKTTIPMAVTEFIDESGKYIYCSQIHKDILFCP